MESDLLTSQVIDVYELHIDDPLIIITSLLRAVQIRRKSRTRSSFVFMGGL